MLVLLIFSYLFLNDFNSVQSTVNFNLDDYLSITCSTNYECSVYNFHENLSDHHVHIKTNKYPNLRIIRIEDLAKAAAAAAPVINQISIDFESNVQLILTNSSVWYREHSKHLDWFKREDIDKVKSIRKTDLINEAAENFNFVKCVTMTLYEFKNQHEIRCDSKNPDKLIFEDLNINVDYLKKYYLASYRQLTYLNLAGKKIKKFDGLANDFANKMLRVNLIDTKIESKPKNFLNIFTNVRELDLPDSLFNESVVNLFKNLPKLIIINTPSLIYWRYRINKFVERFDRQTKCFTLISMFENEDIVENGCLKTEMELIGSGSDLNSYWMRGSSLHLIFENYWLEILAGIFAVIFLISVILMYYGS